MNRKLPPMNFCGLSGQTFQKAPVAVLPVPYNETNTWTTWGAWSDKGPAAIISASRNMEFYDEETKANASLKGIFTLPALKVPKDPPKMVGAVSAGVEKIFATKKFPLVLGGEHSITPGSVRAAKKFFPDLTVLQFDAHADLRDYTEWIAGAGKASRWSHACAARRSMEEGARLVQVGIRSLCEEDEWFMEKNPGRITTFFAKDDARWDAEGVAAACGKNVFITFDLDALDPSIMPSTSTPEPGGLSWKQATAILRRVSLRSRIVGADIVELSPIRGLNAPDYLAARLAYKMISYASAAKK